LSAPHAAGVLALLLSASPNAPADRQVNALEGGAADLGESGPDDIYGYGRLDALAAYNWLRSEPDFTLSASPATAGTLPGGSVTYTVSVTPANGFDGDVALSLTGLSSPQASWTFAPSIVAGGSGSSQLSVTTASSLPPGSYPLTITGTGGGLVRSASVMLVVNPPPDFVLSVNPASRTVRRGSSATYTITVSPQAGFSGTVALSVSGLPSGASATFNPPSVTSPGRSTMSVKTSGKTARGKFTLTVKGTSGALVHQVTVTLTVT
jgi:uncharacterized membrane protein